LNLAGTRHGQRTKDNLSGALVVSKLLAAVANDIFGFQLYPHTHARAQQKRD
jgi:hypothetical protein